MILFTEGESGKSTIVKQMKIINNKETNNEDGYPEGEKKNQIGIIRKNVLDSIEQFLLGRATLVKIIIIFFKQIQRFKRLSSSNPPCSCRSFWLQI